MSRFIEQAKCPRKIVPCVAPLYTIKNSEDGTPCAIHIEYLGLCEDGTLRAVELHDDYFEAVDSDLYSRPEIDERYPHLFEDEK